AVDESNVEKMSRIKVGVVVRHNQSHWRNSLYPGNSLDNSKIALYDVHASNLCAVPLIINLMESESAADRQNSLTSEFLSHDLGEAVFLGIAKKSGGKRTIPDLLKLFVGQIEEFGGVMLAFAGRSQAPIATGAFNIKRSGHGSSRHHIREDEWF